MPADCIANSDTQAGPEVPFYDCPCPVCTAMEWRAIRDMGEPVGTLKQHRIDHFPEVWA